MSAPAAARQWTASGAVPGGAPRRFVPYRHVLHQHRAALRVAVILTVLVTVLAVGALVWSGPQQADHSWAFTAAEAMRIALPPLGGVLVAGPMVADELVSGTYKMAWTQSVTPARWLTAKLVVAAGVLLGLTVPLSVLLWWVGAEGTRAGEPVFATAPYAYALLAVAVGALAGLLVRHTSGAMTVTALALAFTLVLMRSQPTSTLRDQLTLTVPLLVCSVMAVAVAFLLLRRISRGDAP
ncbi:hypothetical protein ACH4SP_41275 [Streptomyces sp. NPDC021093]|uniref:hypothetical protein n=1 Tax=Streptomyces sp. NPDC021093 TaxID=3365112 RepID=UPI0037BA3845